MSRAAVAVSWVVTLIGGLIILGGLGALTNVSTLLAAHLEMLPHALL